MFRTFRCMSLRLPLAIQKFGYLKIMRFVNIPGFFAPNLEHNRAFAYTIMTAHEGVSRENIKIGVLFINRRQILRAKQNVGIMIDGLSQLIPEAGLQACNPEKRIKERVAIEKLLNRPAHGFA